MPTYVFVGRNQLNQQVRGERTAASREQLESLLRREQVTLLSVQEKSRDIALPKLVGGSVSSKELAIFTRQFSVMIDAGLPLVQCLEILASQQDKNKYFKQVLTQVRTDVESGSTLSDAMAKHPKVFDNLYTNMVAAGETGGILDTILQRLATFIEKNRQTPLGCHLGPDLPVGGHCAGHCGHQRDHDRGHSGLPQHL